jgi:hypothetical protein
MTLTLDLSMEAISPQGAYKEILLLWIALVSHLIDCMEMISLARSFQIALLIFLIQMRNVGYSTDLLVVLIPYRLLCDDVQREGAKPSPDLASRLFCYVPLHNNRYGIPHSAVFSRT